MQWSSAWETSSLSWTGGTEVELTRRDALALLGGAAIAALVGGCTSSAPSTAPSTGAGGGSSTPGTTRPTTGSPTPTPTRSAVPTLATLAKQVSGGVLLPGASAYAATARLYNPRFDAARPKAVARCASAADVAACVRFAAATGMPLALRAGGHSYGGWSTGSGLVADVRPLSAVVVDTAARTARIGAGAQLVDVYAALGAKGVAIAGGSCPTVGFTGLTSGGGVGVLTRAYGLTCDAVQSVQIVTADGRVRTVDAGHDPDLFWALRGGGGGSFGAITSWTVSVRAAPTVRTFYFEYPFARAAQVVAAWQSWVSSADPWLWSTCKLLADPGSNSLVATVSGTWIGSSDAYDPLLQRLIAVTGAPSYRSFGTLGYADAMLAEAGCSGENAQSCKADALGTAKRQPFAATSSIVQTALPDAAITAALAKVRAALDVPGLVEGGVSFDSLGGAVGKVAASATPYPYRSALASVQYTATWPGGAPATGSAAAPYDAYVRGFRATMSRWLGSSAYANYADASIADYGPAYWGANYPRLQQVKKQYDPGRLFTFAQAVQPA